MLTSNSYGAKDSPELILLGIAKCNNYRHVMSELGISEFLFHACYKLLKK